MNAAQTTETRWTAARLELWRATIRTLNALYLGEVNALILDDLALVTENALAALDAHTQVNTLADEEATP